MLKFLMTKIKIIHNCNGKSYLLFGYATYYYKGFSDCLQTQTQMKTKILFMRGKGNSPCLF